VLKAAVIRAACPKVFKAAVNQAVCT
jgi:hypothetical protein